MLPEKLKPVPAWSELLIVIPPVLAVTPILLPAVIDVTPELVIAPVPELYDIPVPPDIAARALVSVKYKFELPSDTVSVFPCVNEITPVLLLYEILPEADIACRALVFVKYRLLPSVKSAVVFAANIALNCPESIKSVPSFGINASTRDESK